MEGEPELVDAENLEEIRKRRLAYFQSTNPVSEHAHVTDIQEVPHASNAKYNSINQPTKYSDVEDSGVYRSGKESRNRHANQHETRPKFSKSENQFFENSDYNIDIDVSKHGGVENFHSTHTRHFKHNSDRGQRKSESHNSTPYGKGENERIDSQMVNDFGLIPEDDHYKYVQGKREQSQFDYVSERGANVENDEVDMTQVKNFHGYNLKGSEQEQNEILQGRHGESLRKSLPQYNPMKSKEPQHTKSTQNTLHNHGKSVDRSYELQRNKQILKSVEDAFGGDLDENVRNQILRISLKDFSDVAQSGLFTKSGDADENELSSHKPVTDGVDDDQYESGNKNIVDQDLSKQLRKLLGPEKYQEFVEKSRQDIEALHRHKSKHEEKFSEKTSHNPNSSNSQNYDFGKQSTEDEVNIQSAPHKDFRPKLSRAKNEPRHLDNVTFRSNSELQANQSSLPSFRNYDQVTVNAGANFAYSSDEIYNQAYSARQSSVGYSQQFQPHQPYMQYVQYPPMSPSGVHAGNYPLYSPMTTGVSHEHFQPAYYGAPVFPNSHPQQFIQPVPTSPLSIPQSPTSDAVHYPDYPVFYPNVNPYQMGSVPVHYPHPPNLPPNPHQKTSPRLYSNAPAFVPHPPEPRDRVSGQRRRSFQEGISGSNNVEVHSPDLSQKEKFLNQRRGSGEGPGRPSAIQTTDDVMHSHDSEKYKEIPVERHIEEVRKFHEERRQLVQEDDDDGQQKQTRYAQSSLNRYFSSLEDCYSKFEKRHNRTNKHGKPSKKNKMPPQQSSMKMEEFDGDDVSAVNTDITDDLTMVTYKDDTGIMGHDYQCNETAGIGRFYHEDRRNMSNPVSFKPDEDENRQSPTGLATFNNEDGKSFVTMTSVQAAGITERMEELGINMDIKGNQSSVNSRESKKFVKICPQCGTYNKKYMSWCVECGEVLMGMEPVYVGKKPLLKDTVEVSHDAVIDKKLDIVDDDDEIIDEEEEKGYFSSSPVHKPVEIELPDTESSPNVDSRDSGRPSSGENREDANFSTTKKEVTEICELIEDPVVRGYIKSYFTTKNNTEATIQKHAQLSTEHETPECFKKSKKNRMNLKNNYGKKPANPTDADDINAEDVNQKLSKVTNNEFVSNVENECTLGCALDDSQNATPLNSNDKEIPTATKSRNKHKKKHKKMENIDIEVFERNKSKSFTPTPSLVVPSLNLATSSDDEEARNKQKAKEKELDSDSSSDWEEFFVPKKKNSPQQPPSSYQVPYELPQQESKSFLAHLVDDDSSRKKQNKRPLSAGRKKPVKKETESKVRQSVQSVPYQRHWGRASTAWSSSSKAESRPRSSLVPRKENRPLSGSGKMSSAVLHREESEKNQRATSARDTRRSSLNIEDTAPTRKQRPASADLYKRKQQFQSLQNANRNMDMDRVNDEEEIPSTSQNYKTSASSDLPDYIVEHRLPVEDVMPTLAPDPYAAASTYRTYHQLTPRIQGGQFSRWLCLPDEIWLHILSYVPHSSLVNCAQVCQRLHRVSMDEFLWKYITVKKKYDICDDTLMQIASHHPVSLALIQCHGEKVTTAGLGGMFQECKESLRELNFSGCSRGALTGDNILLQTSSRCRNITHIDTSWCSITDYGLLAISNGCNKLESLCMNGCQVVTDMSFENVLKKHGDSLRILEMFGCFNITPKGLRYISQLCTNLLTLNLGQCYKLTDSCIMHISASLGRVENLDLRGCKQIRDNCVRKIVRNCPRLRMLAFANCPHISDSAILEVATYLPDIRILDVCGCKNVTDVSIRALANNCHNMKNLDISSTGCTNRSISVLANFSSRTLETLKINFLTDVTEAAVIKLAKHCRRLRVLHMYGCSCIKSTGKIMLENAGLRLSHDSGL